MPEALDPRASFVFWTQSAAANPAAPIVSSKHTMKDWGMYDSHSHLYSRDYYHSQTCLPITHAQLDNDSDDDVDQSWIVETEEKLLDEFDDVSPKEKLFMKLWNRHIRIFKIYADHNVPGACEELALKCGDYIRQHDLRANFLLHLYNLWDNGLVNSGHIMQIMRVLDGTASPSLSPYAAAASSSSSSSSSSPSSSASSSAPAGPALGHGPGQTLPIPTTVRDLYPPVKYPPIWSMDGEFEPVDDSRKKMKKKKKKKKSR